MKKEEIYSILRDKKYQWIATIILFTIVLFTASSIRLDNVQNFVDSTTGEYVPSDPDAIYFLRVSQTLLSEGSLSGVDEMRIYPGEEVKFIQEIMPYAIVGVYKITSLFSEVTINYIDIISPVVFFFIGLIFFFILTYLLTKSKITALIASTFLAYIPSYLYRSMAGSSDHDCFGMMILFLAIIVYVFSIKSLVGEKSSWKKSLLYSALTGFVTSMTIAGWGGASNFVFIIFSLSFFLIWIFNSQKESFRLNALVFYVCWVIFSTLSGFIFNYPNIFRGYFLSSAGLIALAVLVFSAFDFLLQVYRPEFVKKKFTEIYSLGLTIVIGFIGLFILGRNPFVLVFDVIAKLLAPFGTNRIGLTVAENAQPYVSDWIAQTGAIIFWMFLIGVLFFGVTLSRKIKKIKHAVIFGVLYSAMILGIVFSKYSSNSILNGEGFVSILVYLIPLLTFWIYFFWLNSQREFSWSAMECVLFAWMFLTIISGRAALRMFFTITPFMCLMSAYLLLELWKEFSISKDKTWKVIILVALLISVIATGISIKDSYTAINGTARYVGLSSSNDQWYNTMEWLRTNTSEDAVVTHWWDYGYIIQELGQRRTISDGGHFENHYGGDHKMGRYVLTTPNPDTALSFFKSMQVDYLLIDQTDLGKYSAYSKIGSDADWDRFSMLPVGLYDASQLKETANKTIMVYGFQGVVDEDLSYDSNGDGKSEIFLPGPTYDKIGTPTYKAYLGAVFLIIGQDGVEQPIGIYVYNNKQYQLPLRYLKTSDEFYDFKTGVNATLMIIPSLTSASQGISLNPRGAMIYLSPKVSSGLFAQLYLLDDVFNNYPTIKLAHEEDSAVVKSLKEQGADVGPFVYYGGFVGPIRIWDTSNIPSNINLVEGFYYPHSEDDYAILDNETFSN